VRGEHRRLPQICREQGHDWRQESWDIEVCARRNCDEQRVIETADSE
jgi:hypothetical protein